MRGSRLARLPPRADRKPWMTYGRLAVPVTNQHQPIRPTNLRSSRRRRGRSRSRSPTTPRHSPYSVIVQPTGGKTGCWRAVADVHDHATGSAVSGTTAAGGRAGRTGRRVPSSRSRIAATYLIPVWKRSRTRTV
jgi:hypothetical protein